MASENQQHMVETCPICKSNATLSTVINFKYLVGIVDEYNQSIYCCDNCEFIFTPNYISEELISRYYKNISKYEGNSEGIIDNSKLLMTERQYNFIKNSIDDYDTVLEIGASTGFNLNTFKKHGKKVFGVEPSTKNKITAKDFYDIDLYDGMYEDFFIENKEKSYDLIFLSHVLEHIYNPNEFIKKLKEQNNKYIYIEVPSFEVQLESEPFGCFFYEHVNHFTINSLTNLMKQNGYEPINLSVNYNVNGESPNYPVICSLWTKSNRLFDKKSIVSSDILIENYLLKSNKNFKKIEEKINNIRSNAKLAVWGTGSHTSRLLGMTSLLSKNIVKFYDSDEKKHDFKIGNKEITSFQKSDIVNKYVDTILISTYSAENSIKSFLKEQNIDVEIISLYEKE